MAGIEDIEPSISRKMQFGYTQETYLLGDLYRLAKAGLDPNRTIEDIEEERLRKLYEKFPEFESGEYENDAAVWTGRVGVMASDPIYAAIPFSHATRIAKLAPRLAALGGIGAGTGAVAGTVHGAARGHDISLQDVAINAGVGAVAGPMFYGVGQGLGKAAKTATKLKDPAYRDYMTPNIFKRDTQLPLTSVGARASPTVKKDLIVVATQKNKSGSITNRYASQKEINDVVALKKQGFENQEIWKKLDMRHGKVSDILKFKGMGAGSRLERMAVKNKKMMDIANYIDKTELPKGTIGVNHPFFKKMAEKFKLKPETLRTQLSALIKEVHIQNNKQLATTARGLDLPPRLIEKLNKLPISPYMHEILIGQGFSPGVASKITEVNSAVRQLMKYSNLEHAFPQGFLKSKIFNPGYELTGQTEKALKKYYFTGVRTSNALNTFKMQFDNKIVKLAEKRFQGRITQAEYTKEINKIRNTVQLATGGKMTNGKVTGGYEIGYMKFVDGKPVPVTPQKSALEGMHEFGPQTTAIINFFKNIKHNNALYKNWSKDKNNPIYGTLRSKNFQFEDELAKVYEKIKNFKTQKQFIDYYKQNKDSPFFKALIEINKKDKSFKGPHRKELYAAAAAGTLTPAMLSTQLSAEELKSQGGRVGYKEGNTVKKEFTEDDKKAYEMWLKDQQKRMEAGAKRHREAITFDALSGFIERVKRGIPPVDERTGLYGFANPDVLDVNLRKKIADDIYLQGGAQFSPNGDPYYSAKVSKTFKDGGRVGHKDGGRVNNLNIFMEKYPDGTVLHKYNSLMKALAQVVP